MGDGRWSTDAYEAAREYRASMGQSDFGYTAKMERLGRHRYEVHQTLSPFNLKLRESRDSQEHPESLAIAVILDVTGSMGWVPRQLQRRLPELLEVISAHVPDAQILFAAVGDATVDRAPLQIGQFESDNRMDEDLRNLLLEGGGGAGYTESYELALYFLARHTALDCHEKRGVKGVAFIFGDEQPYPVVKGDEVAALFGEPLVQNVRTETILKEALRTWDVNFVIPSGASNVGDQRMTGFWRGLLGDRVIELDDLSTVCETLALTVVDRVMSQRAR